MNQITQNKSIKVVPNEKIRVWNADLVNQAKQKIEEGEFLSSSPFYEGDINFRAGDIIYEYTEEEIQELAKCANDIVYFANNYCEAMTDDGIQRIKLRPYQEDTLRHYQNNRWVVFLASRQIGKCFFRQSLVKIKRKTNEYIVPIYLLYYIYKKPTNVELLKVFLYNFEAFLLTGKIYRLSKYRKTFRTWEKEIV